MKADGRDPKDEAPPRFLERIFTRFGMATTERQTSTAIREGRALVQQKGYWEDAYVEVYPPSRVKLTGPMGALRLERVIAVELVTGIESDWLTPGSLRLGAQSGGEVFLIAGERELMTYLVRILGTDDADDQLDALD